MVDRTERGESTHPESMRTHPDVVELQHAFGRSLASPQTVLGDGLLAMAGVWAAISPFALTLGAGGAAVTTHNLVLGLVVTAIGLGVTGMAERGGGLSWVAVPMGVWLIVSTWLVPAGAPSLGLMLSNVITGAVIIVTAAGVAAFAFMGSRAKS